MPFQDRLDYPFWEISQKLLTKGKEYSFLSKWLGTCMFLTTGKIGK